MSNIIYPICKTKYTGPTFGEHIKNEHSILYKQKILEIKYLYENELDFKSISEILGITKNFLKDIVVNQNLSESLHENEAEYKVNMQQIKTEPDKFVPEITTVWSFPNRGQWATHNSKYRGNWSPYIPRNVLLRYSKEGDRILDQFVGSGTTLIEAKLLNRNAVGVDINPVAIELTRKNLDFISSNNSKIEIVCGDARKLNFIEDSSVDLICTHPPYSDIIKYSNDIDGDLSHFGIDEFILNMQLIAAECKRVLRKDKFCAVLIGDTRKKGSIIPLGFRVMETFVSAGFKLKEIIIKEQHNCSSTEYWKNQSTKYNFLLIAHEYLFLFEK